MNIELLNRLIEAQALQQRVLDEHSLESFAEEVERWRLSLLVVLATLAQPMTSEESAAVETLQQQSELLITRLIHCRKMLQLGHQQLVRQSLALSAYNNAR